MFRGDIVSLKIELRRGRRFECHMEFKWSRDGGRLQLHAPSLPGCGMVRATHNRLTRNLFPGENAATGKARLGVTKHERLAFQTQSGADYQQAAMGARWRLPSQCRLVGHNCRDRLKSLLRRNLMGGVLTRIHLTR